MKEGILPLHSPERATTQEVFVDLTTDQLLDHAVRFGEGRMEGDYGPLYVDTRPDTGRSPKDAYVVENAASLNLDFSGANKPMSQEQFGLIRADLEAHLDGNPRKYIQNLSVGAENPMSVQLQTESASAALFLKNLLRPGVPEGESIDGYTMLHSPTFKLDPEKHGTSSNRAITIDFENKVVLIAGTKYFGEEKKSMFKVAQKVLPDGVDVAFTKANEGQDIFSYNSGETKEEEANPEQFIDRILTMHCSANEGIEKGDTALFFGLSGTGKTTLSTDPKRRLIGDDEHAWSAKGIYNLEGGSYAKGIDITPESEPGIFQAAMMRGAVAENVQVHPLFGTPVFTQEEAAKLGFEVVENMRVAFPLSHIDNSSETGIGRHPDNIILLTASDVMPPVAKLSQEEAVYHFLSGYTSKMPGTEIGLTAPKPEFSAGFGHPFLVYEPSVYAELFQEKLKKHNPNVWLVNTGWPDGFDQKRMSLKETRKIIDAILEGTLAQLPEDAYDINELGFTVPKAIEGVHRNLVNQAAGWTSREAFLKSARETANSFATNIQKFGGLSPEVRSAGPLLLVS